MSQNKFKLRRIRYSFSWVDKKQKATINPKNNDNRHFQHVVTAALNNEIIGKHP